MALADVIAKNYVRTQICMLSQESVKGRSGDDISIGSLVLAFFDEACRLPRLSQTVHLRLNSINGIAK